MSVNFIKGKNLYFTPKFSPSWYHPGNIGQVIKELEKAGIGVTVEGNLKFFLRTNIKMDIYGILYITENNLIEDIAWYLGV